MGTGQTQFADLLAIRYSQWLCSNCLRSLKFVFGVPVPLYVSSLFPIEQGIPDPVFPSRTLRMLQLPFPIFFVESYIALDGSVDVVKGCMKNHKWLCLRQAPSTKNVLKLVK